MYGYYSKTVSNQERVIMARVRYSFALRTFPTKDDSVATNRDHCDSLGAEFVVPFSSRSCSLAL